jgi:hypothetical protein
MQRLALVGRSSIHAVLTVLFALWLATDPERARAEELGTQGNLVISADRLFGFYFAHESVELTNNRSESYNRSVIGLGWLQPVAPLLTTTPRLGLDYFLTRNFTLGGNLGFSTGGTEDFATTAFVFAVRAGYALRLGHSVSLWPRGGFTYTTLFYHDSNLDNFTFGLTVEAPFVFALTEGFALTLGPNLDLGFLAERDSRDATQSVFGVMFGLAGWLNL